MKILKSIFYAMLLFQAFWLAEILQHRIKILEKIAKRKIYIVKSL